MAGRSGKTGSNFAEFAEANGGLDGLRRSAAKQSNKTASATPDKGELKQLAIVRFKQPQNALSDEIAIHPELRPEEGSYTLALLKMTGDGKGVIVYACKSKAMLETALAEAGSDFNQQDLDEAKRDLQQKRADEAVKQMTAITEEVAKYLVRPEQCPCH